MAFGGVDIGRNKAVDADSPTIKATSNAWSGRRVTPNGINILAAAVLLIILDSRVVNKANTPIIINRFEKTGILYYHAKCKASSD